MSHRLNIRVRYYKLEDCYFMEASEKYDQEGLEFIHELHYDTWREHIIENLCSIGLFIRSTFPDFVGFNIDSGKDYYKHIVFFSNVQVNEFKSFFNVVMEIRKLILLGELKMSEVDKITKMVNNKGIV